jgi:hypothetical protein
MSRIFKYRVPLVFGQPIQLPDHWLHFGLDPAGDMCLWCEVDPEKPVDLINYYLVATGDEFPEDGWARYVGTVLSQPFVWHLFESAVTA